LTGTIDCEYFTQLISLLFLTKETNIKKYILLLIVFVFLKPLILCAEKVERPLVGLVLSGGGAKGIAHIGVLKMLDSLQIPIDYIAGTSMGGIVGALYAIGYTGADIELIALSQDWQELFSDSPPRKFMSYLEKEDDSRFQFNLGLKGFTPVAPSGFIQGQKISLQFSSLTLSSEYIKNFDDLYIPFRCITADLISGKEVVLKQGSISKAMRATMSLPTIFAPVEWGDSLLIDGGALNNLPVDVVRSMGAEFIIAVDVGDFNKDRKELKSMINVLEQTFNLPLQERIHKHQHLSNLLITPKTENFSSSNFSKKAIKRIMRTGDEAANEFIDALTIAKFQYNLHRRDPHLDILEFSEPFIHGISITGNTTIPWEELYKLIGLQAGDVFISESFHEKISELRFSGRFASIEYEIRPVGESSIRLNIHVQEKEEPIIFGVYIDGYKRIPFKLIYNMLGFKTLQKLDIQLLHKRIDELYGLGYFDTITYEIEPASNGHVKLMIHIKEKHEQVVQLGIHFDGYYKLVASVGFRSPNFLLPGLQLKSLLQFSGRTLFDLRLSYPMRSKYFSLHPYINYIYKDHPLTIYNEYGNKIASYLDRSSTPGFGIKTLLGRFGAFEVGYNNEFIYVEPEIAFPDPEIFPSWDEELRILHAHLIIDSRDDAILPRNGLYINVLYENSTEIFNSDLIYNRYSANTNYHYTMLKYHSLKISGFYTWISSNTPRYKWFYQGGPDTFVGYDYFQLSGPNFGILRLDYRYEHKRDIFIKFIYNISKNYYSFPTNVPIADYFQGWGIGLKFLSIIGPLEIIYARGPKNVLKPVKTRNILYVQAGFNL